jgi:hypothetical protein
MTDYVYRYARQKLQWGKSWSNETMYFWYYDPWREQWRTAEMNSKRWAIRHDYDWVIV